MTASLLILPEPSPPRAPDWNAGRFNPESIEAIKKQFSEKRILAIRVPVTVRPKQGDDRPTYFDVFIEQDPMLSKAEDHYMRQGITISKIATLRERGFRGILVVDDEPLSTLLGDAENPAHTEWLEKATKLKQRYEWGAYTVRFARNALQRIVAQLIQVPEGRDDELLKNIFFLEQESDDPRNPSQKKGKKKAKTPKDLVDIPALPPPARSPFAIQKIPNGFRVAGANRDVSLPKEIAIEVAYEVRRGNAFKKYEKWDFDLAKKPLSINAVSADTNASANLLIITPTKDEFVVEVTGFDPHRDLAIRSVRRKAEESHAAEV